MRRFRSSGLLTVALLLCLSILPAGCSGKPDTEAGIKKAVDSYFTDLKSGAFTQNGYVSSYTEDTPFAGLKLIDEGVRPCMDTALRNLTYEVTKTEGDIKSKTGSCTILITVPDPDEALKSLAEEWITPDQLSGALDGEGVETQYYKVSLQMSYDVKSEAWIIKDSSELAEAVGKPYSELNLYSAAGDPVPALQTFLDDLKKGNNAGLISYLQEEGTYELLYPEDIDIRIRQAFFGQMYFEIQEKSLKDGGYEIDVLMNYIDLQTISDRLAQSADLNCEMYKFVLTGLLSESENPTLDKYNERFVDLSVKETEFPGAMRQQETFVIRMELSADGQMWQIAELPAFMTTTEFESDPASDTVNQAAVGMALIELYDEGIITQTVLDEQLKKYGLESVKYSSRKVVDSLVSYEFIDPDTLEKVDSYSSADTYDLCYKLEFSQDWPDLTYNLLVIDNATDEVINQFEVATETPYPSIYAGKVSNDGKLWSPGSYTLLFLLDDSSVLTYMSVEVK